MARFGFVGPSYTSQSVNADCQECVNWYVENTEDPNSKAARVLYPCPGLSTFCTLSTPVRGACYFNGRAFAVGGATLYELFADGSSLNRGTVANDAKYVPMEAGQTELLLCASNALYAFNFTTNVLSAVATDLGETFTDVGYGDGYYLALAKDSNKVYISDPLDATTWPGAQYIAPNEIAGNLKGMLIDHRELWLWTEQRGIAYSNTGSSNIYDPIGNSAVFEQGIASHFGRSRADNSVFWWGRNEAGAMMAWRAEGYRPQRVSNHAIETAVQGYANSDDVICYSYQDKGHVFWVSYFPQANVTWVYDAATGLWHKRGYWSNGAYTAHRSQCHMFAFGKHLVGDWNSGKVYDMSTAYQDDAGDAIRFLRRSPHVNLEAERMIHSRLQVDAEVGSQEPQGTTKTMLLRFSDDGGHTWSNERESASSSVGNYKTRFIWYRLGQARDRVYEITATFPFRIIDAYLEGPGLGPQERISQKASRGA